MRVLEIPAGLSARERGRLHGETFRPLIAELVSIRTELARRKGRFASSAEVLECARAHLPVLERWSAALHEELLGIAEGARVEPASIVALNHYTDLKDLGPGAAASEVEEDCSAVFAQPPGQRLLGQTWDMHGSAEPYVMMLRVAGEHGRPSSWLLSLTGCLGMAGMNAVGVAVSINNLRSLDAKVGVVWPALVRRILEQSTAHAAKELIVGAPLGSGHHYLVACPQAVFALETSATKRAVVFSGEAESFVHTNHCLDSEVDSATRPSPPESTSHERYAWLCRSVARRPVVDGRDLWVRLGSHEGYPRSVCTHLAGPDEPHGMRTCAGLIMDMAVRKLWVGRGCLHRAMATELTFEGP